MNIIEDTGHAIRMSASAGRLADLIGGQALSLARFPRERLSVEMVSYDLLAQTVFVMVMRLVDRQPAAADTLIDQLAADLHILVEEWRERRDAEEGA